MTKKKSKKKKKVTSRKSNKKFIVTTLFFLIGLIFLINGVTWIEKRAFISKSHKEKIEIISHSFKDSNLLGSVILVKDGKTLLTESYGLSDHNKEIKNTNDTLYPVASLQKKMTAVIIGQLVSEGKLTYETTVNTFFTDLEHGEEITIRDLLNHTSGYVTPEVPNDHVLTSEKEQLENVLDTSIFLEYGEPYYSNGNYSLLAAIISQIEERSYKDVLQDRIFIPLNMENTYLWDDVPDEASTPKEYFYVNGRSYQVDYRTYSKELMSTLLGAGNVYSTVSDMALFFSALNNDTLLSEDEYNLLFNFHEPIMLSGNISEDGAMGGYSSYFYGDITNQTFIIFLANQSTDSYPDQLLIQVYQQLLLF